MLELEYYTGLVKLEPGSRQLIAVARRYGFNAGILGQANTIHKLAWPNLSRDPMKKGRNRVVIGSWVKLISSMANGTINRLADRDRRGCSVSPITL